MSVAAGESGERSGGRWVVSGVGALLVAVGVGYAVFVARPAGVDAVRLLAPVVGGALVTGYGTWVARRDVAAGEAWRIAGWSALGAVAFGLFGGWQISLGSVADAAAVPGAFVLSALTVGAVAGTVVGHHDHGRRTEAAAARRARSALEAARDGIAILSPEDRYETVNPAFARVRGYDSPDELVGQPVDESFSDPETAFLNSTVRPAVAERGQWEGELTAQRPDGSTYTQHTTVARLPNGGSVVVARDVTRRREQERRLQTLVENAPVAIFEYDEEGTMEFVQGRLAEELGLAGDTLVGESMADIFPENAEITHGVERALDGAHVEMTVELAGRYLQTWVDPVVDDGTVVRVVGTAVDVTDRVEYEETLDALHDATRRMMSAEREGRVCEVAVETASETLGLPLSGIWLADESGGRLEPAVTTAEKRDAFDTVPTYGPADETYWNPFEAGETTVVATPEPDTDESAAIRSEVVAPLGSYGLLKVGRAAPDEFDEGDVGLVRLLAANTAAALERTERERTLSRRTDQMEFFNSILRHDVLNGMTVIRGRSEILASELDGTHGRYAETIVSWCDDITDVVSRVRQVLTTLTSEAEPALEPTNLTAHLREEVDRVSSTYPDVTFETDVEAGVTVQADDLLAEVVGNLVTNAVEHNDSEGLVVAVSVAERDGTVVLRVADNGRGVPDEQKEAVFRRGVSGHAKSTGSGFGLFFVDAMVDAYRGEVRVEDADLGGAAFVVELPASDATGSDT